MMRVLSLLAAIMLPALILSGCAGTGVSSKEEIFRTASTAQANTAVFYWKNDFISGLERIAFYQDDAPKGSISKGQVLALPLQPGDNQFQMSWEEALDLPISRNVAIRSDPKAPSYYLITETFNLLVRYRGVQPVTKDEFFEALNEGTAKDDT